MSAAVQRGKTRVLTLLDRNEYLSIHASLQPNDDRENIYRHWDIEFEGQHVTVWDGPEGHGTVGLLKKILKAIEKEERR
jgi:hypothetical protein